MRGAVRFPAILICLLSLSSSVRPCLQPAGDHYKVRGIVELAGLSPSEYVRILSTTHETQEYWRANLASVSQFAKDHPSFGAENNIAVALVHLGRTVEAIRLLEREEKKYPDGYYTAANLGTAFELAGDNAKALRWIKEGMARKEDSHYGTEWLHVKILEAKIAMAKDKRWLEQNTVLGLDWQALGSDLSKVLVTGHDGKVYNATAVQKALEYQLHERTEFVKPPDPIVGQLLVDLSKLVEVSISPEHGVAVLRLAASYDTSIQPPPEPPTAALEVVTVSTPILSRSNLLYLAVPFAAFLFLTLLIVWRRKKGGIKPPFP